MRMASPADIASDNGRIESAVCHLDAERGRLTYRGYDVNELARHATFEEVAYLLVAGALPTRSELKAFGREWVAMQKLSSSERRWLRSVPTDADELTVLRTAVSALPLAGVAMAAASGPQGYPGRGAAAPVARADAGGGAAAAPARRREGPGVGTAGSGARLPPGGDRRRAGRPTLVESFDAALILRADNELNPGTYAARVAASTGADLTSCITAAMGALAGPKHSGHTPAVARLLAEVGSVDRADTVAEKLAQAGKKPAGFGHPVYRGEDPRTPTARRLAEAACAATGHAGPPSSWPGRWKRRSSAVQAFGRMSITI